MPGKPGGSGGGVTITGEPLPPGSIYTIGSDPTDRKLAMFLLQTQVNPAAGESSLWGISRQS